MNDIVVDHVVRKMMQDTITGQTPLKRDIEVPEVSLIDKMRCPEDTEVLRSFYSQLEEKEQDENDEKRTDVDNIVDPAEATRGQLTTKGLVPLVISEDVDCDDSDGSGSGSLGSARSNGGGSKNRTPFAVIEGSNSAPASPQRHVATTEA